MKTLKYTLTLSALALAMGASMPASSATILFSFDPTGSGDVAGGGGPAVLGALLDQAPGSALAVGGVNAIGAWLGTGGSCPAGSCNFSLLYQANLSAVQDDNSIPVFSNGTGGNFFNFTLELGETVTDVDISNPNEAVASFAFNPAGNNSFNMWLGTGNNLTGAGFGQGTPILSAVISSVSGSTFTINNTLPNTNLDGFVNNDWPGTTSRQGVGTTDLTLTVTSANAGYFPDLVVNQQITIAFLNTSQITPFTQANPSKNFIWATGGAVATNVGAVNGQDGPDILFQADANTSFDRLPVPEIDALAGSGALTLLAGGLALVRERRRRA